jgi:Tfp pilus assembly PilM family ATPase
MSNIVAIELNESQLLVACARASARRFQIWQAFQIEIRPDDSDDAIAEKLKRELHQRSINRAEAIAIVARQKVEIREITVPPAPDNELPDMVRFQARNEFSALNDAWSIDYIPFDSAEDKPRRVLAIAISPQVKGQITSIFGAAGLKLKRILFRPFCIRDLMRSTLVDGRRRLIVAPTQKQIDLTITDGMRLVTTRSVSIACDEEPDKLAARVLGDIRQTLRAGRAVLTGGEIEQVLFCGLKKEFRDLHDAITENIKLPVEFVNPARFINAASLTVGALPQHPEHFAALLGALAQEFAAEPHPIDFLHPRRPIVKKTDHRRLLTYGSVAAVVVVVAIIAAWWALRLKEKQIAELGRQLQIIAAANEGNEIQPGVQQIVGEVNEIDDWNVGNVNWLDQLAQVSQLMLTPDDVIVDSMDARGTSDNARIIVKGRSAELTTVTKVNNSLSAGGYSIRAKNTGKENDDPDYAVSFGQTMELATNRQAVLDEVNRRAKEQIGATDDSEASSDLENDIPTDEPEGE